jgi:hypothetical protein
LEILFFWQIQHGVLLDQKMREGFSEYLSALCIFSLARIGDNPCGEASCENNDAE